MLKICKYNAVIHELSNIYLKSQNQPNNNNNNTSRTQITFLQEYRCVIHIEYFMESARVRCLHTSCGVSEIEQVSEANE